MWSVELFDDGQVIALTRGGEMKKFHAIWLRDNAWDEDTRAKGNGQRLITLRDIPKDISIEKVEVVDDRLLIDFLPEAKQISYDLKWLMANAYDQAGTEDKGWVAPQVQVWDSALMDKVPSADFTQLQTNPTALEEWLFDIRKYGFATLKNGPVKPLALLEVVDLFGFVRETNYGRYFEVRTEINPSNLAFTGLGLQAHTDNPYRDPVPTVQVLYCLESTAEGGDNMVVDGFAAALKLRQENSAYFDVLSRYCARFEYSGEAGVKLQSRRPMIELSPDGELIGVRFNNRSAAAITDVPFEDMALYYEAYRRFGEIIDDPQGEVSFRLDPGQCFVVDNTRVLHARKAYSGEGKRWLQGCYADRDGLYSTLASLESVNKEAAQ